MAPVGGDLAPDIRDLPPNPIRGIEPVLAKRKEAGDVIHGLHIGNRADPLNENVASALAASIANHDFDTLPYVQSAGTPEMRSAYAEYFDGLYTPDQVVVTAGASEAMLLYTLITQAPGEANVIFPPSYPNYWTYGVATGRKIGTINRDPASGFRYPTEKEIHQRLDSMVQSGENPVSMTVIAPDNPTGVIPTESELMTLFTVAKARGMWVFGDLAYNHLAPSGSLTIDNFLSRHTEFMPNTVLAASVSKEQRGCGARLGWIASASPQFVNAFTQLAAARGSVNSISQKIFPQAISDSREKIHQDYNDTILPRVEAVCSELDNLTGGVINVCHPQGGLYCWIDLSSLGIGNTADFTAFMASTYGERMADQRVHTVTIAPGSGFYGKDDPEAPRSWARIALTEKPESLVMDMGILVRGAQEFVNSIR